MRLELVCLHTLHILANCIDHMDIHYVIRQCIFPNDIPEHLRIKRFIHHPIKPCPHFRVIAIAYSFNQQVSQGFIIKRNLAENIENLSAERQPFFLNLLEQPLKDITLTGLIRNQIPKVADLCLPDTMDTAKTLFQSIGIPRQVIVNH